MSAVQSGSTPARDAAMRIEAKIRRYPNEMGVIISPNGQELFRRTGFADRVPFKEKELLASVGATFTHNHPSGNPHSLEDIELGAEFHMHEVRVVTQTWRFVASGLDAINVDTVRAEYNREVGSVRLAVRDDVKRGQVHPTDFSLEVLWRLWLRVSGTLGFFYWRES